MRRPRLLIAEDHRIVAEGLKRMLEDAFDLVGVVEDGRSLVAEARRLQPDVIVADISMPHLNGIEALLRLRQNGPGAKVVILSMHHSVAYARRAIEAGAAGYVLKHAAPEELQLAIDAALRGGVFVTPALAKDVLGAPGPGRTAPLTLRQREILQLLAEGLTAKQVAERLAISPRTVEFHKYQLMRTHDLHNVAELVHFAIRHGVTSI
jgi:DNA-binding NarL/FixJ family response regulator